jgi:hypothetical protein
VDVVASSGWLHPALAAMEMCQMVVQGQWEKDSPLLQLPHFTPQLAAAAAAKDVSTVFDLVEMEDEDRRELLQVRIQDHRSLLMLWFTVNVPVHCYVPFTVMVCLQILPWLLANRMQDGRC